MGRATHLMTQTITVTPFASRTKGDITYGTPYPQACRIDRDQVRIRTATGEVVEMRTVITTETAIDRRSLIHLPGEDTSDKDNAHRIIDDGFSQTPYDAYALYTVIV
jgi:hypothetical protein